MKQKKCQCSRLNKLFAKSIDKRILEILEKSNSLVRWREIKDKLAHEYSILPSSLGVKIHRSLQRLLKMGLIERHDGGHQNISYSLNKGAYDSLKVLLSGENPYYRCPDCGKCFRMIPEFYYIV